MEPKRVNNLSKRQQISASSKTVFIWVAGASVVVAFCLVAFIFLFKQMMFNEKVLAAKSTTDQNLKSDILTSDELKKNVNLLLSNSNLAQSKAPTDSSNLQVIFDALPTIYDSTSFGASLQNVLLAGSGVSIDSLSVQAPDDGGDASDTSGTSSAEVTSGVGQIPFTLTMSGSADQIRTALENMEKSIRPIQITSMTIDGGSPLVANVEGVTFYQPPVSLKLHDKVVQP